MPLWALLFRNAMGVDRRLPGANVIARRQLMPSRRKGSTRGMFQRRTELLNLKS